MVKVDNWKIGSVYLKRIGEGHYQMSWWTGKDNPRKLEPENPCPRSITRAVYSKNQV